MKLTSVLFIHALTLLAWTVADGQGPGKQEQQSRPQIRPGIIYKDANVTVTAFPTKHAMESYGYRFDTYDRRIVISGDTSPTEETIKACSGCDILVHDART